ncbi:MAG: hypothetical protein C5B44_04505, partial [Acidobacteria bacterium]
MTTRRRFFAPPSSFERDSRSIILPSEEARHLRDVLRLKPGDSASVFDGTGNEYECSVDEVRRDYARLIIASKIKPKSPESLLDLTLALALLKADKFDFVVQKATELGVNAIVPVMTRHADIRLRDDTDAEHRCNRWQRIALEATKQSGRAKVPVINLPREMNEVLEDSAAARLMFSERFGDSFLSVTGDLDNPETMIALVGSEGGWHDDEISKALNLGWRILTLGG